MRDFISGFLSSIVTMFIISFLANYGYQPPGTKTFVLKYPDKVAEIVYQHIADVAKVDMGVSCGLEKK